MNQNQQNMTLQDALELGVKHHQSGDLENAEGIYQQILQVRPDQPIALHLLGVCHHQRGDNPSAVTLIAKAIKLEPNYAEAHSNLSLALSALGKTHEAIASCKKAISIKPDYAEAHNNLGLAMQSLAKPLDSEACYRTAIKLKPDYSIAYNNLGNILQDLGKIDEAIESYQKAIEITPTYADAHNNIGNALRENGQLTEAIKSYKHSVKINDGSAYAHANLADTLKDITYNKLSAIKKGASFDEQNGVTTNPLSQQQGWKDVMSCVQKVLEIKANDTQGLALKTSALIGLNRLDEWKELCNFNRLIQTTRISAPKDYATLSDFNEALYKRCAEDPNLSYEQGGKSIKNGERINALQLDVLPSPVALLLDEFNQAIQSYKINHPKDKTHPYLTQQPDKWTLTAWASILQRQGHHQSHIHRSGWVSGVYYGRVPNSTITGNPTGQGYIEFGRPSNHFENNSDPDFYLLKPEEGLLVLFPSYFYHQTIPFESNEIRFTVAFDAIPAR